MHKWLCTLYTHINTYIHTILWEWIQNDGYQNGDTKWRLLQNVEITKRRLLKNGKTYKTATSLYEITKIGRFSFYIWNIFFDYVFVFYILFLAVCNSHRFAVVVVCNFAVLYPLHTLDLVGKL